MRRPYRAQAPKRANTGPSAATRELVAARAGGRCERCGTPAIGSHNLHHRSARGRGGTKRDGVNEASNLLYLCGSGTTGCHGWVESHRALAYQLGLLVHSWDDPREVRVLVWTFLGNQRYFLTDDGRYVTGN